MIDTLRKLGRDAEWRVVALLRTGILQKRDHVNDDYCSTLLLYVLFYAPCSSHLRRDEACMVNGNHRGHLTPSLESLMMPQMHFPGTQEICSSMPSRLKIIHASARANQVLSPPVLHLICTFVCTFICTLDPGLPSSNFPWELLAHQSTGFPMHLSSPS